MEIEKYLYVIFFFSGGCEVEFLGEECILINLLKVVMYDLKFEMSIYEVMDVLVNEIENDKYDVIIFNFVNCDMVGYFGMMELIIKVVEVIDECLGKVVEVIFVKDGVVFIIVDYGNVDEELIFEGELMIVYIINLVFFIVIKNDVELCEDGILGDIVLIMFIFFGVE